MYVCTRIQYTSLSRVNPSSLSLLTRFPIASPVTRITPLPLFLSLDAPTMKITSNKTLTPTLPPDLAPKARSQKPIRRKKRAKPDGAPPGRRSRPETPLLKWKFNEREREREDIPPPEFGRKSRADVGSARRLGAVLWRMQLPAREEHVGDDGERSGLQQKDLLGLEHRVSHIGMKLHGHYNTKECNDEEEDVMQSPRSVSGPRNVYATKFGPSYLHPNSVMEGTTKWDPISSKMSDEVQQIYGRSKYPNQHVNSLSAISALEAELEQARDRIQELESERHSSKKKLEHFLKKLSEERATWRSREHEKIRSIIDDIKNDLHREKKNRQRLEIINSKLVDELADAKSSAKRYSHEYEKERKARILIEEVCDELAKEFGEDKAEAEALRRDSMKLREEVDEERKMLQMAEVWREERVQMKLIDAKIMLEEKYSEMNKLVKDLESFLNSKSTSDNLEELRRVEVLRESVASMSIQEIRDLSYEPPNPDDIFSVFEDVNFGESNNNNKESPGNKNDLNYNRDGDVEEDESEWESVSQLEEGEGSSYSPIESVCEETPVKEISEATAISRTHSKKVSSISRLWKSGTKNSENFKIISFDGLKGRLSNGASYSPCSEKGRFSNSELSSPESRSSYMARGRKGCIGMPMGSLKAKLLEARMESQKVQLKQVLKQKF